LGFGLAALCCGFGAAACGLGATCGLGFARAFAFAWGAGPRLDPPAARGGFGAARCFGIGSGLGARCFGVARCFGIAGGPGSAWGAGFAEGACRERFGEPPRSCVARGRGDAVGARVASAGEGPLPGFRGATNVAAWLGAVAMEARAELRPAWSMANQAVTDTPVTAASQIITTPSRRRALTITCSPYNGRGARRTQGVTCDGGDHPVDRR
jgi:hypothetical protein